MNSTVIFLTLSVVVWGGLTHTVWAAGLILLGIFAAQWTIWRWQITLTQFYRWGDLSSLLTTLLVLYLYLGQSDNRAVFVVLKWLPVLFAPVLFTQLFSIQQKLPLATLFYSLRKKQFIENNELDFQLPYIGLTLMSAGAANVQNLSYFALVIALFIGILWRERPAHAPKWLWLLLMSVAIVISYRGQLSLRRLQNMAEYYSMEWLGNWHTDPFKTQTSMGELGEMKLSDSILFRVQTPQPLFLMQASYDQYLGKSWIVSHPAFADENPLKALPNQPLKHLEILQEFLRRDDVLALPDGTVKIDGLEGADLQYSAFGAVKISNAPDLVDYRVTYTGYRTDVPSAADLQIPKQHRDWLMQISHELKLAELKPPAIVKAITSYFQKNFRYSLYLGTEADAQLALRDFMLQRKAGHCEYFAVASALLLRQAGIPARLANGYVVEEYDTELGLYIVRRRHAHAWAIAYINGIWQQVDSTPADWIAMENKNASVFSPLNDWVANRLFLFKQWQTHQTEDTKNALWLAAAFLLSCYIGWRIYLARRQLTRVKKSRPVETKTRHYPGLDSDFYLIERHFVETDFARAKNESIQAWVKRLNMPELQRLAQLHYQLRFDPGGGVAESRVELQRQVGEWFHSHATFNKQS